MYHMLITHFVRQFPEHFLLCASKDKWLGKAFKQFPLIVIHLRSVDVFVLKCSPVAQQSGIDELHQVPEFSQVILDRRTCKDDPASCLERHGRLRHSCRAVFNLVCFIQADNIPVHCLQDIHRGHQNPVTDKEQISCRCTFQGGFPVLQFIKNDNFQGRCKTFCFSGPVRHHRFRSHHEGRPTFFLMQEESKRLNGLAQTHVIGQAGSCTPAVQTRHPLIPLELVIAERCIKSLRQLR